jgi:hypothetical protein
MSTFPAISEGATVLLAVPEIREMPIDSIRPYWRNPRQISEHALAKVRESIERYGYQSPIIVDPDGMIVTGHTRYAVLRQLGTTMVPVIVSNLTVQAAKEYRLIDNRTGELNDWDQDLLAMELRSWEAELLGEFFPEITLDGPVAAGITAVTPQDMDRAQQQITSVPPITPRNTVEVVCPHCFKPFTIEPPEE